MAHDFQEKSLPEKYLPMRDYMEEQTLLNKNLERVNRYFGEAKAAAKSLAMPCCMIATPDRMNVGNMAADGVRGVWNNKVYETFRLELDSADPPEICQRCSVYHQTF